MSPPHSTSGPWLFAAVLVALASGLPACGSRTDVLDAQGGSSASGSPDGAAGVDDSGGGGPDATTETGASDAGACPSGDSVCEGACVDQQTDPGNCGGCGVVCAGTCEGGRCLDSTTLYCGDSPIGVMTVPLTGGAPTLHSSPGGARCRLHEPLLDELRC